MAKKEFFIPQIQDEKEEDVIEEESLKTQKPKYQSDGFVSSLYGKNVKDTDYIPGVAYGNNAKQYDSFRGSDKRNVLNDFEDYIYSNRRNEQRQTEAVNIKIPSVEEKEITYDDIYKREQLKKEEFVNVKETPYIAPESNVSYEQRNNSSYSDNSNYGNNSYYNEEPQKPSYQDRPVSKQTSSDSYVKEQPRVEVREEQVSKSANYNEEKIKVKVEKEVKFEGRKKKAKYVAPPLNILRIKPESEIDDLVNTNKQRAIIDLTLKQFDIKGHVVNFTKGPTVTQFEVKLDDGVLNQKIIPIQSNLQGNLHATSIRLQIPIPGRGTIGIEVPNVSRDTVYFGDMIQDKKFLNDGNPMNVVLGVNISGEPVYMDIAKMPHGLIAGSTGSGKSVCINGIICSILYKAHPDDVKLILVDPKRVEFKRYSGIPHLATPIITEPKMANLALQWVVDEMENRYSLFESIGVAQYKEYVEEEVHDVRLKHLPYLVIIIDELADLMMTAGNEVETSIMRITQKARAAGIHLIVATQRPAANIVSGNIKTNIPTRIAFKVQKAIDSNIIIDHTGAEKLLGLGDMLYTDENGVENRIQGAFISGHEIKEVVDSLSSYQATEYLFTEEDLRKKTMVDHSNDALDDELFQEIARYVVETNNASINTLQRKFSCGFSRIQAIIIKLGELGVVSENLGSRAREVLVNMSQLEDILRNVYGD